ncbi:uncharacterized protein A4U43_C01F21230 [Asparagus officinalis]|uniref:Uncharacterized protein n=1 Tax=Asparagus officinalis TaxID=4686 RepID=A0A5P1FRV1_ASPOF|nr:uncharacterized protein A4U43_C01F21230 [Asparagus officinalis]
MGRGSCCRVGGRGGPGREGGEAGESYGRGSRSGSRLMEETRAVVAVAASSDSVKLVRAPADKAVLAPQPPPVDPKGKSPMVAEEPRPPVPSPHAVPVPEMVEILFKGVKIKIDKASWELLKPVLSQSEDA